MKPSQDVRPITFMKTSSAKLVEMVVKTKRPIVITQNGEARVVVLDIDSYEKNKETMLLLKIAAQGIAEVESGKAVDQDVLFDRLEKKVKNQIKPKS